MGLFHRSLENGQGDYEHQTSQSMDADFPFFDLREMASVYSLAEDSVISPQSPPADNVWHVVNSDEHALAQPYQPSTPFREDPFDVGLDLLEAASGQASNAGDGTGNMPETPSPMDGGKPFPWSFGRQDSNLADAFDESLVSDDFFSLSQSQVCVIVLFQNCHFSLFFYIDCFLLDSDLM